MVSEHFFFIAKRFEWPLVRKSLHKRSPNIHYKAYSSIHILHLTTGSPSPSKTGTNNSVHTVYSGIQFVFLSPEPRGVGGVTAVCLSSAWCVWGGGSPSADLREREPEARGSHPAAGHPDTADDLLPLLGAAGQHWAHPPAGAAEPGSSQVSRSLKAPAEGLISQAVCWSLCRVNELGFVLLLCNMKRWFLQLTSQNVISH